MPETTKPAAKTGKQTISARSKTHSDVADSAPARKYQAALTEREFGEAVLRFLRENPGEVRFRNLQEEWLAEGSGYVHEIRVEAEPVETI